MEGLEIRHTIKKYIEFILGETYSEAAEITTSIPKHGEGNQPSKQNDCISQGKATFLQ